MRSASVRASTLTTVLHVSLAAFAVTLASGIGALYLRRHQPHVYAFCSGALIGGALFFLLPDARELLESTGSSVPGDLAWLACALGFLFFYLFGRGETSHESARLAGLGGTIGLATHSFFDGVVIGQGFQAGEDTGMSLALAVLLHKLADGVSVVGIMLGTEHNRKETGTWLVITAAAPALGAAAQSLLVLPASVLALFLGWFAGMFLYLGANQLLPEARQATRSLAIPALSLVGVAMTYVAHALSH